MRAILWAILAAALALPAFSGSLIAEGQISPTTSPDGGPAVALPHFELPPIHLVDAAIAAHAEPPPHALPFLARLAALEQHGPSLTPSSITVPTTRADDMTRPIDRDTASFAARLPQPAHQFFGDAATGSGPLLNGALAPDGTVIEARNESGRIVGLTVVHDGRWLIEIDPYDAITVQFRLAGQPPSQHISVEVGGATTVGLGQHAPPQAPV